MNTTKSVSSPFPGWRVAIERVDWCRRDVQDAIAIATVSAVVCLASDSLGLPAGLFQFAVDNAQWKIADVVFGVVVLSVALLVYVSRRRRELTEEITRRRELEQKLNREKQQLDAAVDNIGHGLVMFDDATRLVVCNKRYIDMYGLTPEVAASGQRLKSIIAYRIRTGGLNADASQLANMVEATVRAGKPWRTVSELADGRSIDVVTTPLRGGGWVAMHEDISERRRAERELRRTERLLLSVIENVPTVITMKDARSLRYLFVNKAGEALFGLSRSKMIGYLAHDLFPQHFADLIVSADRQVISSGMGSLARQYSVEAQDGLQRTVSERRLPIKDENGDIQCLLGLIDDVTRARD